MIQTATLERLAPATQEVVGHARELAAQLADDRVHSGHLLFSLMCCHTSTQEVLAFPEFGVSNMRVLSRLVRGRAHPGTRIRKKSELSPVSTPLSPSADKVLQYASYIQGARQDSEVTPDHLLLGMLMHRHHYAMLLLERVFEVNPRLLVRSAVAVMHGYSGSNAQGIEPWVARNGIFDDLMALEELVIGHWRDH